MRGHTGGGTSMGRGFPITKSTKQKLNTRSSTESELVSVDDCMPAICWTRYFLLAQGYGVQENILYQDNQSAILLEKNGKASSSKRTKHIHICFFFVTDRIEQGELSVEWCPTGDMIGDFMTKPTQGALFQRFRDQIMGVCPVLPMANKKHGKVLSTPKSTGKQTLPTPVSPQECVGQSAPRAHAKNKQPNEQPWTTINKREKKLTLSNSLLKQ